jgi:hypothetical protein
MGTNDRKNPNKTRNKPIATGSMPENKIKAEELNTDAPGKPGKARGLKAKVQSTAETGPALPVINEVKAQNASPETTMEIHHHPQLEHKHKPWKEYLLEGLMIFIAVMMGFIAENIREDITNSQHVKQLTSQLVKDLKSDIIILNVIDSGETQIVKYNDTLISLLQQPLGKVDTRRMQKLVTDSHSMWLFTESTGAISAIKNELHLKQFSNSGIIGLFSEYERQIELLHMDQGINLQYQRIYLDPFITQHFTPANMVASFGNFSGPNAQMRNLTQADLDQLAADMVLIRIISKEMVRDNKAVRKDAVNMLHYVIKQYSLEDK